MLFRFLYTLVFSLWVVSSFHHGNDCLSLVICLVPLDLSSSHLLPGVFNGQHSMLLVLSFGKTFHWFVSISVSPLTHSNMSLLQICDRVENPCDTLALRSFANPSSNEVRDSYVNLLPTCVFQPRFPPCFSDVGQYARIHSHSVIPVMAVLYAVPPLFLCLNLSVGHFLADIRFVSRSSIAPPIAPQCV